MLLLVDVWAGGGGGGVGGGEKVVTPESPSETQGRSLGPGEKTRQKFLSTGGKAPGYRTIS